VILQSGMSEQTMSSFAPGASLLAEIRTNSSVHQNQVCYMAIINGTCQLLHVATCAPCIQLLQLCCIGLSLQVTSQLVEPLPRPCTLTLCCFSQCPGLSNKSPARAPSHLRLNLNNGTHSGELKGGRHSVSGTGSTTTAAGGSVSGATGWFLILSDM
jgi:hypothetical protein